MLRIYIEQFLHYCQVSNFTAKSIEAFRVRLEQFHQYCQTVAVGSVSEIGYQQLSDFVADFQTPSVHVKKSRVWALHQFYHFLKLNHMGAALLRPHITQPFYKRFGHRMDNF